MKIKNKNKSQYKIITSRINSGLLFGFIVLFVGQLAVTNHAANQRYQIGSYSKEYAVLEDDTQKLSLQAIQLQSSERLLAQSQKLQLVKASNIHYLEAKGPLAFNK